MSNAETVTAGERTYAETVARGFYGRSVGGLVGKYDNVRAYWEDELTRVALRPFLQERLEARASQGRGLRVLDLGCGAGQGYELITKIHRGNLNLDDAHHYALPAEKIEVYLGLDLSEAMIAQGRDNYRSQPNVRFEQADLREGLGAAAAEAPFDVYFSSYGSLSHLDADSLRRTLVAITKHGRKGALIVLDLLGRYSPEWPEYWSAQTEEEKVRLYSMSYLYSEAADRSEDVERFWLRFWTGQEVREMCSELGGEVGLTVREIVDRSIFVGRHVDTGEYGTSLPPVRSLVNRLFEPNVRTRLEHLRIRYRSVPGSEELNRFFAAVTHCWNTLIEFTITRLRGERINLVEMSGWREHPPALQMALVTMDRVIDSVAWIDVGDVRANIIEPQLAFILQRMQHRLQEGRGCGHGLLAVLQIGPSSARS